MAGPLPDADANADPHGLLLPAVAAVPLAQYQWPGIAAPGVDSTCFGCRAHAFVPLIGRKRRSADADAEAVADADADAEPHGIFGYVRPVVHSIATAVHPVAAVAHPLATVGYPAATFGHPLASVGYSAAAIAHPVALAHQVPHVIAPAVVGSSSYQSVINNGAAYTTGVSALHPVSVVVRGRRGADAEADADADAEANAEADAFLNVNGYTHALPGHSYAALSTPSYVSPIAYPLYNHGLGYNGVGVYHG